MEFIYYAAILLLGLVILYFFFHATIIIVGSKLSQHLDRPRTVKTESGPKDYYEFELTEAEAKEGRLCQNKNLVK